MALSVRQMVRSAIVATGVVMLGTAVAAAWAASEPVVYVYDVQVTGTLRASQSLPSKPGPLDFAYSEISKWTESYKGARLEVQTSEIGEPTIALTLSGKGTVAGSVEYGLSGPRIKSCGLGSNRPEPASLNIGGSSYGNAGPGAATVQLRFYSGRSSRAPVLRSSKCSYIAGNSAKLTGARVGTGGGTATGSIDTRRLTFTLEFRTPQQPGRLGFPLNRLQAGSGFVLDLKGKTRDGRRTSEGTARIAFVPRPS